MQKTAAETGVPLADLERLRPVFAVGGWNSMWMAGVLQSEGFGRWVELRAGIQRAKELTCCF